MTHIVVISTSYPYRESGSEAAGSFVEDFVIELAKNTQVTVVTPGDKHVIETSSNIIIQRFAVPNYPLSLLNPINPFNWLSISKILFNGMNALEAIAAQQPIDHVLALWSLPSGFWARRLWKKHHIPYSTWSLGSDIWSLGKIPLIKMVLRNVLRDGQYCFADGHLLKNDVERISKRRCDFLPSSRKLPVHSKKLLRPSPPYRFAFLGRWHPNKGVDLLLESLELLSNQDWNKIEEIRICGGGPLEEVVNRHCEDLKSHGHPVSVFGYLNKKEATKLLLWADYLIIPSRIESIPVIFSDAMQAGCPIVATPVGDMPRLLHEFNVGVQCSDVKSSSIAEAISKSLTTSPLEYTDGLKEASLKFSVDETCDQFLNLIRNTNRQS